MASSTHNNHLAERSQQQQQGPRQHHNQYTSSSAMMQQMHPSSASTSSHPKLIGSKESGEGGAYSLGELDEALFLYLNSQQQHEHHQKLQMHQNHPHHSIVDLQHQITDDGGIIPPTLNIFPSQPMHVEPPAETKQVNKGIENDPRGVVAVSGGGRGEASGCSSSKMLSPEPISMDILANSALILSNTSNHDINQFQDEGMNTSRKGPALSSKQQTVTRSQMRDAKTLRRLAQNREAARKSRLRKKVSILNKTKSIISSSKDQAYVQQLESSRIKLAQLEQEIQRARSQGMCFSGGLVLGTDQHQVLAGGINNFPTAIFDMEYARWLEEHQRRMCELRAAVEEHLAENELQLYVDNCLAHYDEIIIIKSALARTDVFHLISGSWKSPAERCFMWIGGFRPSQIIKILMNKIDGLTEQQAEGMCELLRSTEGAEEALSQGLELLNQSLSDTITYDSLTSPPSDMANYMGQMAIAESKLSALEGFIRQADNLRHQTVHRLHQVLMTRQAARGLLLIAEYFHRLRALSSLWQARPMRE